MKRCRKTLAGAPAFRLPCASTHTPSMCQKQQHTAYMVEALRGASLMFDHKATHYSATQANVLHRLARRSMTVWNPICLRCFAKWSYTDCADQSWECHWHLIRPRQGRVHATNRVGRLGVTRRRFVYTRYAKLLNRPCFRVAIARSRGACSQPGSPSRDGK